MMAAVERPVEPLFHSEQSAVAPAAESCSRSGSLRTVFGARLCLLFAIGSGLQLSREKHDAVLDLLTRMVFELSRWRDGRCCIGFLRTLSVV
jgi:hypothetical protein